MSVRCYAIVCINHNAAEVFRIDAIEESKLVVNSHTSQQSLHHGGHAARPDLAAHVHEFDTPGHAGDAALVALARDQFHLVGPPRQDPIP